jgi:cyanophycinase
MKRILFSLLLMICLAASTQAVFAQQTPGLLIPMGGGYSDVYAGFSAAAVANARNGQVKILVLPAPYSTNPISISGSERQTNIRDAEQRRFQIEEACKRAAPPDLTCSAILIPVFTRDDASDPATLSLIPDDLSAVFILGGDQTVAMQALAGTPLESRLTELHQQGVIFAGTSAGGGMLSRTMLGGYNLNYAAENALFFGAPDVWNTEERHGLPFGLQNAVLDQHFYQRARFGRLLNAILLPDVPHLGVGVDAYTGVIVEDEVLRDVFGLYTVTILDAETYHAAESVKYIPLESGPFLLSARNVLVNLLSPGEARYDLKSRQHSLSAPAPKVERDFESLSLPDSAGTLILAGDLSKKLTDNPVIRRFSELTGGENANLVLIAIGYPSERSANTNLEAYAKVLPGRQTKIIALGDEPVQIPPDVTGILVVGKDQSRVSVQALAPVRDAWLSGVTVLADNAAAPLMGAFYSAHAPTPDDAEMAELATQKSFWQGKTEIRPGLGLVEITLEPQMLSDNRFGRWFSLAYNHPELLAVGLNQGAAVELNADQRLVLGINSIFILDLRQAKLALGTNNGFVIANGLLDVFAPGEILQPEMADVDAHFNPQPTPILPANTPTATATAIPPTMTAVTPLLTATPETVPSISGPVPSSSPWLAAGVILAILIAVGIGLRWRKREK